MKTAREQMNKIKEDIKKLFLLVTKENLSPSGALEELTYLILEEAKEAISRKRK